MTIMFGTWVMDGGMAQENSGIGDGWGWGVLEWWWWMICDKLAVSIEMVSVGNLTESDIPL